MELGLFINNSQKPKIIADFVHIYYLSAEYEERMSKKLVLINAEDSGYIYTPCQQALEYLMFMNLQPISCRGLSCGIYLCGILIFQYLCTTDALFFHPLQFTDLSYKIIMEIISPAMTLSCQSHTWIYVYVILSCVLDFMAALCKISNGTIQLLFLFMQYFGCIVILFTQHLSMINVL